MNNIVYLHTGSNHGKRMEYLENALSLLKDRVGNIIAVSSIYETSAWGKEDQPDFLNQAIKIETSLTPIKVLEAIQKIENLNDRKRLVRWGERTLDIDLLFYNHEILNTEKLILPHPRLHKRNFVLFPLSEIDGAFIHPVFDMTIEALKDKCTDSLEVRKKS